MTDKEALLLNKLKNWRNNLAKKLGKPSYYILSNQDLSEVINKKPSQPRDFLALKGWGRKKAEKYAEDILKIIASGEEIDDSRAEDYSAINNHIDISDAGERTKSSVSGQEPVFSVSEYIEAVNITVSNLGQVKIQGEISAVNGLERGYAFFDLRDINNEEILIKCVIFHYNFSYFSHLVKEGSEVIISGSGNIYPKNGSFRVVVENIEPVGEGAYKKALEELRKKMERKGYFETERKRPLPFLIQKIGLITSSHGAAIHDFEKNLGNHGFRVFFKDVFVEGGYAEKSIIEAIRRFNKEKPDLDIVALIRGGGNWESLKVFNSEKVVEALITSRIPIITGIGHESDETMVGLASDKDCSTPTAVANFLSNHREVLKDTLSGYKNNFIFFQEKNLIQAENYLKDITVKITRSIDLIFNQLESFKSKFISLLNRGLFFLERREVLLTDFKNRLAEVINNELNRLDNGFKIFSVKIESANPERILQKGYSAVFDKDGRIIKNTDGLSIGQKIKIRFFQGTAKAEIKGIEK
ncbi:MAG: exodeoxyribonuclease VII large subunit [Candidatus Moranbacteria bacterium]|jgi:exodeoxyribonuclease VII large subunit|nr:exodeoxyribonuclease VII large subunit [Candidatus Moranbacteria bacterium]